MIIRIPSLSILYRIDDTLKFFRGLRFSCTNVGHTGERFARSWLIKNNFYVLEQNWSNSSGELDLIAIYGRCLHIIEVKTRHAALPEKFSARYAVDRNKAEKIALLAGNYMYRKINLIRKFKIESHQIDLLAVSYRRLGFLLYLEAEYLPNVGKLNP